MSTNKLCPVTGGWCWKNPVQVGLFLAVLPFAVKGAVWVWNVVAAAVTVATK
jgi:hypothetical protein